MGFSDEDQILMENLYISKVVEQKVLIKEFPNKGWGLWGLDIIIKEYVIC